MATLTLKPIVAAGLLVALDAANTNDEFPDDGSQRTYLEVNNGGGGSINATATCIKPGPYKVPGVGLVTQTDRVVAVAAGARKKIGPFPAAFINPNTGRVAIVYSGVATVTAGAFTLAKEES